MYNWQEAVDIYNYNLFANVKFQSGRGRAIIIIKRTREPWQSPYKGTGVEKAWECCQHTFLALYIAADESNKNASSHSKHGKSLVTYKWEGNFNQWILILLPLSSFRESIPVCLDNPSRWGACENVGFFTGLCLFLVLRAKHGGSKNNASAFYFCDDVKKKSSDSNLRWFISSKCLEHPANCFLTTVYIFVLQVVHCAETKVHITLLSFVDLVLSIRQIFHYDFDITVKKIINNEFWVY